jgi:hypothetical protein
MPTTSQMLLDYPDIMLQVLAELRNAFVDAADSREVVIELLAAQISDPTSVQMAFEEAADYFPDCHLAVESLLKEGGEMAEAQFSRQFGGIRQMGPAKLQRETPWEYPESTAELLYYYGLIGRTFRGAGQKAHTIIYIPSDVAPWLPHPQSAAAEGGLAVRPITPPPAARALLADDNFLEDMGSLLGFLHTERLRLTPGGPHAEDIDRLVQRFQLPFEDDAELNVRLALLLHLANRLGWLRRGEDGCIHLTGNRVRLFLEQTRPEQRLMLWDAWRNSPDWNDLCRTPGLECAETGNWKNDPLQTRAAILQLLAKLQPGAWYNQSDVIHAIQETEPDFQRPTGNYDTWYIRKANTQEFLSGFDQWDAVEGTLLRFLVRGPLYWLGALDLAEPSSGDDMQLSLSRWGSIWLGQDSPQPYEDTHGPLVVGEDFSLRLPLGTPLHDRFRVERFAAWQASYPQFIYQINQRSLKRAADEGIPADRVLAFLQERVRTVPAKVRTALERLGGERSERGEKQRAI